MSVAYDWDAWLVLSGRARVPEDARWFAQVGAPDEEGIPVIRVGFTTQIAKSANTKDAKMGKAFALFVVLAGACTLAKRFF